MLSGPAGYGAYGKMPALGDFFRIGLPPSFVDPWDRWLQSGLAGLRDLLGPRWEDCYMTAPIWRFTLDAGVAGPQAAQGVLMPSVDRVGRQFPLTLLRLLPGRPGAAAADAAGLAAFEALEEVALDALDDSMTRDRLSVLLARVPVPAPVGPNGTAGAGQSLWSALIDGQVQRIAHAGLPAPAQMRAFFDPAPPGLPPVASADALPADPLADPLSDPLAALLADAIDDPPADEARP
jgi:type VI secretion system protein ImpM